MWMFYPLQENHLIIDHSLVAFDILLEYYLDGVPLASTLGFSNDSICASTKGPSELVLGSV